MERLGIMCPAARGGDADALGRCLGRIGVFALLALLCVLATPSHAEIVLDEDAPRYPIGEGIAYLEDAEHVLSAADMLERTEALDWEENDTAIFGKGYSASTWWLRFEVDNALEREEWLLVVDYPVLDELRIWQLQGEEVAESWALGDKRPFDTRPLANRAFVVPVRLATDATTTFLISVNTSSSVQVPLSIWRPHDFHEADATAALQQGTFLGALIIIAIYNVLLYFAFRDSAYLLYVCYVSSMAVFGASISGWTFQHLWPEATMWNDRAILVSLGLGLLFANAFVSRFLTRKISVALDRLTLGHGAIGMLLALAAFHFPYDVVIAWLVPFAGVVSLWGIVVGIYCWNRGVTAARWYSLSLVMLVSGVGIFVASKYGLVPRTVVTEHALQLGTVLQVVLISFALAERINNERTMRLRAQHEALETQRVATSRLESRVAERTRELESANARLEELSTTDQLTGLRNRRYLEEHLQREFAHAARHRRPIAVLLLDIDHFKQVNDVHGHLVGDECLREVGRRIRSVLRDSDLAARYGGEEFCVVLTEPRAEGAVQVAERLLDVVASGPIGASGTPVLTISIGCRVGVPGADRSPQTFLQQADEALYASKANGRARVTLAEPGSREALRSSG